MALNKRGFFYFVELMIIIIVVALIWSRFPTVQTDYNSLQEHENLRQYGFGVMRALDDTMILSTYINSTAFEASNFSALRSYVQSSFPETVKIQLEYIINSTTCYNQTGTYGFPIGGCGLNETQQQNAASVLYTFSRQATAVTIRLQMISLIGGRRSNVQ